MSDLSVIVPNHSVTVFEAGGSTDVEVWQADDAITVRSTRGLPFGAEIAPQIVREEIVVSTMGVPGRNGSGGGTGSDGFDFVQLTPTDSWSIIHNLGYRPNVQSFTTGGMIMDGDVVHHSVDNLSIVFLIPVAGSARLA